jgi:hypothetical protein
LLRNAQKRDKKIEQNNRGRKKKEGEKTTFFVMSPRWIFVEKKPRVFEPPLLRNAQKRGKQNAIKTIKIRTIKFKVRNCFVFGAAHCPARKKIRSTKKTST